ncbi:MAG: rhomboid family intramembrane serine protease [Bacilli bacterium]|nr:rhomboid family intramembrane serine protease [Bacilli bacterium]
MDQVVISKNDELVMKLLHYFITEKGYSPIVLHGAKDEIWLENMDSDYKIVRIVSNYIHNNEQLNFDLFRTKQIMKQIKKKTFSYSLNTLSLFVNLGDSVEIEKFMHLENVDSAKVDKISDLKKYDFILDVFPTITKDTSFKEKGLNLFMKITSEISKKNEQETIKNEEVFKEKTPYVTYLIMFINLLVFLLCNIDNSYVAKLSILNNINDEYYRVITSGFTHVDIFHIFFNMYALYIIGSQIESFIGRFKYSIVYLGSLVASSMLSMAFLPDNTYSLGASGAIFGLFGSLLVFGYHYRVYLGTALRSQIVPIIILNLMLGFMIPGIDIASHIGGLVAGLLITIALGIKYKSTNFDRLNGTILLFIYTIFLIYISFIK